MCLNVFVNYMSCSIAEFYNKEAYEYEIQMKSIKGENKGEVEIYDQISDTI